MLFQLIYGEAAACPVANNPVKRRVINRVADADRTDNLALKGIDPNPDLSIRDVSLTRKLRPVEIVYIIRDTEEGYTNLGNEKFIRKKIKK